MLKRTPLKAKKFYMLKKSPLKVKKNYSLSKGNKRNTPVKITPEFIKEVITLYNQGKDSYWIISKELNFRLSGFLPCISEDFFRNHIASFILSSVLSTIRSY